MTKKLTKALLNEHMTVLEIVSRYRETEAVFKTYDATAGECICCHALFERLGDVCAHYNLDLEQLMSDLEFAITSRLHMIQPEKEPA